MTRHSGSKARPRKEAAGQETVVEMVLRELPPVDDNIVSVEQDPLTKLYHVKAKGRLRGGPRRGMGEYYQPGSGDDPVEFDRSRFLESLASKMPAVVDRLRDDVRPPYRLLDERFHRQPRILTRSHEKTAATVFERTDFWLALKAEAIAAGVREFEAFETALVAWLDQHDLRAEWMFDRVLSTFYSWLHGARQDQFAGGPTASFGYEALSPEVLFRLVRWNPLHERQGEHEARARREFESFLSREVGEGKAWAEKLGWRRVPSSRRGRDEQRALWPEFGRLVEWQVERATLREIASRAGLHWRTIEISIRNAARRIALAIRPGLPGRPRGTTPSSARRKPRK